MPRSEQPAQHHDASGQAWFNILSRRGSQLPHDELACLVKKVRGSRDFAATQARFGIPLLGAPFVKPVGGQALAKRNMRSSMCEVVKALLDAGLDPLENFEAISANPHPFWFPRVDGRPNPALTSPLALAHVAGDTKSLALMLGKAGTLPARLAFANPRGDTWLHEAAAGWLASTEQQCEVLVKAGMDPWAANAFGRTPLDTIFSVKALGRLVEAGVAPAPDDAWRAALRMHLVAHRDISLLGAKAKRWAGYDHEADMLREAITSGQVPPIRRPDERRFPLHGFPRALSAREIAWIGRLLDPPPARAARGPYMPDYLETQAERLRQRAALTRPAWNTAFFDLSMALGGNTAGTRKAILAGLMECLLYDREVPARVACACADGARDVVEALGMLEAVMDFGERVWGTEMEVHGDVILPCIDGIVGSLLRHAPLPEVGAEHLGVMLAAAVRPFAGEAAAKPGLASWVKACMQGWSDEVLLAMPVPDAARLDDPTPLSDAELFRPCRRGLADALARRRSRDLRGGLEFRPAHDNLLAIATHRQMLLQQRALARGGSQGGRRRS